MPERRSATMKAATALFGVFIVAIVLAFIITVSTGTAEMQAIAAGLVVPIIILSIVFIRFSIKGKEWSFAGASVLGVFGVAIRLIVSTEPNLEVGGGLPVWVSALYVILGVSVALLNLACVLGLRRSGRAFKPLI